MHKYTKGANAPLVGLFIRFLSLVVIRERNFKGDFFLINIMFCIFLFGFILIQNQKNFFLIKKNYFFNIKYFIINFNLLKHDNTSNKRGIGNDVFKILS